MPSALTACVRFLQDHEDFVAATGETVGLFEAGNSFRFGRHYPERQNFILAGADAWGRAEQHMSDHRICGSCAVTRIALLALSWGALAREEYTASAIQERKYEAALASSGKMVVLPNLIWIRNNSVKPIRAERMPGFDERATFESGWLSAELLSDRRNFAEAKQDLFE